MIQLYRNRAKKAGIIFIVLNLIALLLARQYVWIWFRMDPLGQLFWLIITISAFSWYYNFAKAKGYSGWFSLLGLLHLVGFIIILALPDHTKQPESHSQ